MLFINRILNAFCSPSPQKIGKETNVLRPVMFWIHGGGFFFGTGNSEYYGPEYLVAQDVVLVTFNYRLGILGKT